MKITLSWTVAGANQASSFVLADSPDPIPMTNFRVNGSRNIQEAQFFRAVARNYYDRGNRKTSVSFETTRLFTSQQAAESFILLHETQFPGQFLATFLAGSSGGGATSSCYLKNAVVTSVESRMKGCTTYHTYKIDGGVMSASAT